MTKRDLDWVAQELNDRPRKRDDYVGVPRCGSVAHGQRQEIVLRGALVPYATH